MINAVPMMSQLLKTCEVVVTFDFVTYKNFFSHLIASVVELFRCFL